ncbi:MAG TPA: hypothetical protein VJ259_00590 [Actinomycetota bacterium]|nr:hypothetical protein [Actinomycetota bacterium]
MAYIVEKGSVFIVRWRDADTGKLKSHGIQFSREDGRADILPQAFVRVEAMYPLGD